MNGVKKRIIDIGAKLIFPIIFNVVFFTIAGAKHPASVWIAYGFIHFSYLMFVVTPLLAGKSSSSVMFANSLYTISTTYFVVELAAGIFFIFLRSESYKYVLLVQIVIVCIYIFFLLSGMSVNEQTAMNLEIQEEEVWYIKGFSSRVKLMVGKMNDKKADKELEKLYDLLHSSPSKSNPSVRNLEMSIESQVDSLERAVRMKETESVMGITGEIMSLMEERNRMIRAK